MKSARAAVCRARRFTHLGGRVLWLRARPWNGGGRRRPDYDTRGSAHGMNGSESMTAAIARTLDTGQEERSWHTVSLVDVFTLQAVDEHKGLTSAEAAERRQ